MEHKPSLDDMRGPYVQHLVDLLWEQLVGEVIKRIKALPDNCRQSGDDSGLENVWEEYKDQVQGQESIFFDAYIHTIESLCHHAVLGLSEEQRALLWLWGDEFVEWEEEGDQIPFGAVVDETIENELFRRVSTVASDEELEKD